MALQVLLFCGCLAVSIVASLVFGRQLDRVSDRLRLSEGLHGILTALGADAPEVSTAVAALLASHAKLGVGVVIGSNVFNLAALLGLSAIVAGQVRVHRHGLLFNGGVALLVLAVATPLVLGAIGALVATLLLAAILMPYVYLLSISPARIQRVAPALAVAVREEVEDLETGGQQRPATLGDWFTVGASLVAIVLASIGMVHAATSLGRRWGISDLIVGTLVLAVLTSLPNVITAVRLALHGRGAAVISETLNSNSLNVLAGIAIPGLVVTLGAASGAAVFSAWWLVALTLLAVVVVYARRGLRRSDGVALLLLYGVFAGVIASR